MTTAILDWMTPGEWYTVERVVARDLWNWRLA